MDGGGSSTGSASTAGAVAAAPTTIDSNNNKDQTDGESAVDPTFGAPGGREIDNKSSILAEVDHALGCDRPPDLEYILVMPFAVIKLPFGYGISYNSYGHAALRYTRPNGEQCVMNIVGKKEDAVMVQFSTPEKYLFSTTFDHTTEQRGVYNRHIITLRVEHVPPEKIEAMHQYFLGLRDASARKEVKFNIILSPLYNIAAALSLPVAVRGNCAWWTSQGLKVAGVTTKASLWPKSIFINMFENSHKTTVGSPSNMHVVSYRRIKHAHRSYGIDAQPITAVAPLQSARSVMYYDLERFANVVVEVPPNSYRAEVAVQDDPAVPSRLRNIVNSKWLIGASVVATFAVLARQSGVLRRNPYRLRRERPDVVRARWRQWQKKRGQRKEE